MPMFVSIDYHSEKCVISYILSSNILKFVSVCIADEVTGNGEQGTEEREKSSFLASYLLCCKLLKRTPKTCVFPFSSPIREQQGQT